MLDRGENGPSGFQHCASPKPEVVGYYVLQSNVVPQLNPRY